MKGLTTLLLVLIVAALGYMIYDKQMEKQRVAAALNTEIQNQQILAAAHAARAAAVEKAILEHRVIRGMKSYEVHLAWGRDYQVERVNIPEDWKRIGVFEVWEYRMGLEGFLGMSVNGEVLGIGTYTK